VADSLPEVSVVLPVYNGSAHLREAIESILSQADVDLELILVDDGSTDDSWDIATSYTDRRVRIARLHVNRGLANALNHGIAVSRAPLVARQDQDDVSYPDRLRRQADLLSARPNVVLVGTWATIIAPDSGGGWVHVGGHRHPADDVHLRLRLLWNNPFVHSSVMFRRQAAVAVGCYGTDPTTSWPEDYDLWSRLAEVGDLANIPETLLIYRQTPGGMSEVYQQRIAEGVLRIACRNLARALPETTSLDVLEDAARCLNSMPVSPGGVRTTTRRALTFWRAARGLSVGMRPAALGARIKWTTKLVLRSLKPAPGSLGA
jgi:glycosyltransferase involved in cell wall biosynthesis